MSVTLVGENGARLEEVRGDLDQIRHWVATQVSGWVSWYCRMVYSLTCCLPSCSACHDML